MRAISSTLYGNSLVVMRHPDIGVPLWTKDSGVKPSGCLRNPSVGTYDELRNSKLLVLCLLRNLTTTVIGHSGASRGSSLRKGNCQNLDHLLVVLCFPEGKFDVQMSTRGCLPAKPADPSN